MRFTNFLLYLLRLILDVLPGPLASVIPAAKPWPWMVWNAHIEQVRLGDFTLYHFVPRRNARQIHIVYFYGSGYFNRVNLFQWGFLAGLMRATGASITVPAYPLAPAYTAETAQVMFDALTDRAMRRGTKRLVLMGDSAGATIALTQVMRRRDRGSDPVDALVLIAPWLDVTMSHPDIAKVAPLDRMIRVEELIEVGSDWAGELDPRHPFVSPLFGNLSDLPPITIIQGGRDTFLPDVRLFADKARAAGTPVKVHEEPNGFHDYPMAFWVPESRTAIQRIAASIT